MEPETTYITDGHVSTFTGRVRAYFRKRLVQDFAVLAIQAVGAIVLAISVTGHRDVQIDGRNSATVNDGLFHWGVALIIFGYIAEGSLLLRREERKIQTDASETPDK